MEVLSVRSRLQRLTTRGLVLVSLALGATGAMGAEDALFKYRGKAYGSKDLSAAEQQALYEADQERYMRLKVIADEAILGRYFDEEAKKAGKTRDEIEAQLLAGAEPSDKEVEAFYQANKDRIPPQMTLDQVRGQIKEHLKVEVVKKRRDELTAKARKAGDASLLLPEPLAPVLEIQAAGFPTKGAKGAKVVMVEFADYQCPHCKAAGEVVKKLLKKYDGRLALTFIDFPINQSGISRVVAQGAYCAEQQGKYWEFHDRAFDQQRSLTKDSPVALAKELKLDEKKFQDCMATPEPEKRVAAGRAEGERLGIGGTPTIFVNGRRVAGYEEDDLEKAVEHALKGGV